MKRKILVTTIFVVIFSALFVLLIINRYSPNQELEVKKLYGNTINNLMNGGSVAKQDNKIFFVVKDKINKINSYDQNTKEVCCLKSFISIPSEISIYDKYLFFKKNSVMSNDSGLYRLHKKTKFEKKVICKPIEKYMIYENSIYYTIRSQSADTIKGLYKCNVDGKREVLLISENVSEFVVVEKDIYYIAETQIKHFNIETGKVDVILCAEKGREYYDLSYFSDYLYFVSGDLNDAIGDSVCRYEISNKETTTVFKDIGASIRFVNDTLLIFENQDGFYQFDLKKNSHTKFLDEFSINEISVFDSDIYFYTTNLYGTIELWYSNINDSKPHKLC